MNEATELAPTVEQTDAEKRRLAQEGIAIQTPETEGTDQPID